MTIDYADLIARLEAASEGNSELDWAIYLTATELGRIEAAWSAEELLLPWPKWIKNHPIKVCGPDPYDGGRRAYTRLIDCALTLLPEHISYELTRSAAGTNGLKRCRLWDWRRGPLMSDPGNEWKSEGNSTLPLHICIAALRVLSVSGSAAA